MDTDVDRGLPLLRAGAPPLPALWGCGRVGLAPAGLAGQRCPSSAGGDGRLLASLPGRYCRRIGPSRRWPFGESRTVVVALMGLLRGGHRKPPADRFRNLHRGLRLPCSPSSIASSRIPCCGQRPPRPAAMGKVSPPNVTTPGRSAVNGLNQSAGPFVPPIPPVPSGGSPAWGAYTYTSSTAGTFSITASGDGTTITVP